MIYLLLTLTGIITVLQTDKLTAKPTNVKAWSTVIVVGIATLISIFIERHRSYQETQEKIKNDSISDLRVTKSNKIILTGIGDALAKYNLGYDSATKQIKELKQLIKDSANRKTTIIQGDNPVVTFCEEGITLDSARTIILSSIL